MRGQCLGMTRPCLAPTRFERTSGTGGVCFVWQAVLASCGWQISSTSSSKALPVHLELLYVAAIVYMDQNARPVLSVGLNWRGHQVQTVVVFGRRPSFTDYQLFVMLPHIAEAALKFTTDLRDRCVSKSISMISFTRRPLRRLKEESCASCSVPSTSYMRTVIMRVSATIFVTDAALDRGYCGTNCDGGTSDNASPHQGAKQREGKRRARLSSRLGFRKTTTLC